MTNIGPLWLKFLQQEPWKRLDMKETAHHQDYHIVATDNHHRLRCYQSSQNGAICIVPSLINRMDIFDLTPQRSLIKKFMDQGMGVYALEWNDNPSLLYGACIQDYLKTINVFFKKIKKNTPFLHTLWHCMSGHFAPFIEEKSSTYTLLTTPWTTYHLPWKKHLYALLGGYEGVWNSYHIKSFFNMLRPEHGWMLSATGFMEAVCASSAMMAWSQHHQPLAMNVARMYAQRILYNPNPMTTPLLGRRPFLKHPLCIVACARDQLVPWQSCLPDSSTFYRQHHTKKPNIQHTLHLNSVFYLVDGGHVSALCSKTSKDYTLSSLRDTNIPPPKPQNKEWYTSLVAWMKDSQKQ